MLKLPRVTTFFFIFAQDMAKQRIAYIDAMRGFTMILVVYAHICYFCMDAPLMGFNRLFFLFRLPCFFMISGWLFEPIAHRPFKEVIRHKAMVQLLPTFIFLLLLAPPPEFFHQLGTLKGGYWFTFVLFEFFVLYLLIVRLKKAYRPLVALTIALAAFCCARYYNEIHISAAGAQKYVVDMLGFMSITLWRFFLFFYIGAWMRRNFEAFIRWTNHPFALPVIAVIFFLIASTAHRDNLYFEMFRFFAGGISGMWMIFTCFRLFNPWLEKVHLSKPLQYVGTRTLDIYLLHYFFLPRFLISYAGRLQAFDNQFVEFIVILAIALVVLAITLLASYIIRLSPFLGHYLFGVKNERRPRCNLMNRFLLFFIFIIAYGLYLLQRNYVCVILPHNAILHIISASKHNNNHCAVIICPGGGYSGLARWHEGFCWIPYFHHLGFTVAILDYRIPNHNYMVPVIDGYDALSFMRNSSGRWGFDNNKIGVMGFSSGGHLASFLAVSNNPLVRPNFVLLFYPVVSMKTDLTQKWSHDNLLGENASEKLEEQFSNEQHVSEQTPPVFIAVSKNDSIVNPQNSIVFYRELRKFSRPVTLRIYPTGGHGWGYNTSFTYHKQLIADLTKWLNENRCRESR